MQKSEILAAIDATGEVPANQLFADTRSQKAALNLINTLAEMRRDGQIVAVKTEQNGKVYRRAVEGSEA